MSLVRQAWTKIMTRFNLSIVFLICFVGQSFSISPPSIIETQEDKTIVTLTIPYGKKYLEVHGVGLNNTFRDLHMAIIEYGLKDPEMILFQVEPNNIDTWMRAYDLTEELLRSL